MICTEEVVFVEIKYAFKRKSGAGSQPSGFGTETTGKCESKLYDSPGEQFSVIEF